MPLRQFGVSFYLKGAGYKHNYRASARENRPSVQLNLLHHPFFLGPSEDDGVDAPDDVEDGAYRASIGAAADDAPDCSDRPWDSVDGAGWSMGTRRLATK
jgi:hypothetical protein